MVVATIRLSGLSLGASPDIMTITPRGGAVW
jgi:hypothetical protein